MKSLNCVSYTVGQCFYKGSLIIKVFFIVPCIVYLSVKKISVIRHNVLGELKILLADQRCPNNNNIHQIKSHKLLNDTEKRDIFRWRPRVTIAREDRSMVREPRFRRRTTTREVETYYMRRDYEIVIGIFTSWLRLNFHLFFLYLIIYRILTQWKRS